MASSKSRTRSPSTTTLNLAVPPTEVVTLVGWEVMPRILEILWSEYDDEKDENATGDVDMTLLEAIMEDWQRTLEEREAEEAVDNGSCADPVL